MDNKKWLSIIEKCFLGLFPNPRAWTNFICTWVFLTVMITQQTHEPLIVLVSGFATVYCFNEWAKQTGN